MQSVEKLAIIETGRRPLFGGGQYRRQPEQDFGDGVALLAPDFLRCAGAVSFSSAGAETYELVGGAKAHGSRDQRNKADPAPRRLRADKGAGDQCEADQNAQDAIY